MFVTAILIFTSAQFRPLYHQKMYFFARVNLELSLNLIEPNSNNNNKYLKISVYLTKETKKKRKKSLRNVDGKSEEEKLGSRRTILENLD